MKRRKFIQGACCSVLGVSAGVSTAKVPKQKKTHVITLSFDDGWGPMSSKYLTSLLMRLTKIDQLAILPTGEVVLQLGTFG